MLPQVLKRMQEVKNNNKDLKEEDEEPSKLSFSDVWQTLKRLFTNKPLFCNNMAAVFYTFGYLPFSEYQVKYIEIQYRFSSSTATLIQGTGTMLFSAIGFVTSGIVISIFKPKARYIAAWNVFGSALSVFGIVGYAFLGCSLINNVEMIET